MSENTYDALKENFIKDWANDYHNFGIHFRKYGEDNVRAWIKEDYVILKVSELIKDQELRFIQFNNFKKKAYDIVALGFEGKNITDHQLKLALWFLSGEKSFYEAFGKIKGEQHAYIGDQNTGTILELVYAKKTD